MSLKGIDNVFVQTLNNEIQDNLIEYFDWGLLERGNYFNVTLGEEDYNGNDYSALRESSSSSFSEGQAWEGFRKNWIWQSGVNYTPEPIVGDNDAIPGISGVYVDNVFYPSDTTGAYAHKVDYFNGRVVFDNAISLNSKVQAEFSYKYINIIYANSVPWIREFYLNTLDVSNRDTVTIQPEMQIQLPAIAIEIVPKRTMRPYQLGRGQFVETDVLFHCIAENDTTRNKLVDIVSMQNDSTVEMFNSNAIASGDAFPLNNLGYPNSGAMTYPELIDTYKEGSMFLNKVNVQTMDMINSNIHAGIVRFTCEIISSSF